MALFTSMAGALILDFDGVGLFEAMDAQRVARGLSWREVADEIWALSAVLNTQRQSHPISPSTLVNVGKRGATSCQHALFMLRWLGRSPESFLKGAPQGLLEGAPRGPGGPGLTAAGLQAGALPAGGLPAGGLPAAGPDRRLRWDLKGLYAALDARRHEREMTWPELARELRCTPSQLTGLRTARFATGMNIAMHIVQWLDRPAADFVYLARW